MLWREYKNRVKITLVPNITNICYGRGVGYKIEEIVLDEETQTNFCHQNKRANEKRRRVKIT